MVKKLIKTVDYFKASGPNCIPLVVPKTLSLSFNTYNFFDTFIKESRFLGCCKVLIAVPAFKNVGRE